MRFIRRFQRKFSISAPRLAVRPHVPWYVRGAIVVPILAVIGMMVVWAYDSGLELAGFHRGKAEQELSELHDRVQYLEEENTRLTNLIDAYERKDQIEQASDIEVNAQVKRLNDENARLKEDLLFFQNLPLTTEREAEVSLHRMKIEPDSLPGEYRLSMLLVQSVQKRGRKFRGNMQLVVNGEQDGDKVVLQFPQEDSEQEIKSYQLSFKYYQRVDKVIQLPPEIELNSVEVRVFKKGTQEPKVTRMISLQPSA